MINLNENMKKNTIILLIIAVILIAVSVIAFLALNSANSDNKNRENNTPTSFDFNSALAEISFKYPSNYGKANENLKIVSDSSGLVTAGKADAITFSNNKDLSINLVSVDYQGFKDIYYSGVKDFNDICVSNEIDENGNGCKIRTIGTFTVLEQTEYLVDEGVYNLVHSYSIKLANNNGYSGLKVMQSIPEIYDELNRDITEIERNNLLQTKAKTLLSKSDNSYNAQINEIEAIISSISFK